MSITSIPNSRAAISNPCRVLLLVALFFAGLMWFYSPPALSWQDDMEINLEDPMALFSNEPGFGALSGSLAHMKVGRYLIAGPNHGWRGAAMGDVGLLHWGDSVLGHMGLAMETLADDHNEISFRLVQVYYQVLLGAKWRIGPGHFFELGYRHRCTHGADDAMENRITIRSGALISYRFVLEKNRFKVELEPAANWYMIGQNSHHDRQAMGASSLIALATWPLVGPVSMNIGAGLNLELYGRGPRTLYFVSDPHSDIGVEPLFSGRLGVRFEKNRLKNDYGLRFVQNFDSGLGRQGQKSTSFLFDIDFMW